MTKIEQNTSTFKNKSKVIFKIISLLNYDLTLTEKLQQSLEIILSDEYRSITGIQNKGGIFTVSKNVLNLKVSKNLAPNLLVKCKKVEFGKCLCGRAALSQQTIYKQCMDQDHEITFDGIQDHGHYNVPILFKSKTIGVMVLYLDKNSQKNEKDIEFLNAVATALSQMITYEHHHEKILRQSNKLKTFNERYQLVLDSSDSGFFDWLDIRKDTVFCSEKFYNILGYDYKDIKIGIKDIFSYIHVDDNLTENEFINHFQAHQKFSKNIRIINKINYYKWVKLTAIGVRDASGELSRVTGAISDIHEEELVKRDLEQFSYIISHDLQTPLRQVRIYAQILEENLKTNNNKVINHALKIIVDGTLRMSTLFTNILTYSKRSKVQTRFIEINLKELLDEIVIEINTEIKETGTEITYNKLDNIGGDKVSLKLLFKNLILNSMKFAQNETKNTIKISTVKVEHGTIINIDDNGIGIEEQYREKVFMIFKRLHTHQEFSGSGIGLAFCKQIIDNHQGRINFTDTESKVGIRCTVFLPDSCKTVS